MKTSTRQFVLGLFVGIASWQLPGSFGAETPVAKTVPPERFMDIQVVLAALSALTETRIAAMADALAVAAEAQEVQALDWGKMKPLLEAVQQRFGPANVWYARPDGSYFTVEKGLTEKNLKDRAYFAKVMAGQRAVGELVVSRATGGNTVITAVPILKQNQVIGILGASIYLEKLARQIRQEVPLPDGVVFYALDPKGQIALHTQEGLIFQEATQLGSPSLTAAVNQMLTNREGAVSYEFGGGRQKALFQSSGLTGWRFAIRFPSE